MKKELPFTLKLLRKAFPILEKVFPRLAHNLYIKLFLTPRTYPIPENELNALQSADQVDWRLEGRLVRINFWGPLDGKKVIFLHGWAGRATQGIELKDYFVKRGYEFIAVDLPAHGFSEGKQTNLLECAKVLNAIVERLGKVELVIGHSFGGAVIAVSRRLKSVISRHVTIGTPHDIRFVLSSFRKGVGATKISEQRKVDYFREKYGITMDDISPIKIYEKLDPESVLIIHDVNDKEIPYSMVEELRKQQPELQYFITEGLGHRRILKDEQVGEACLHFMENSGLIVKVEQRVR